MLLLCLIAHALLLSPCSHASKQYFTSTSQIVQLLALRSHLADALMGFADNETARLNRIRDFALSLRNHGQTGTEAAASVEHPVAAFLAIKKMGHDWRQLLGNRSDVDDALRSLGIQLPTPDDLDGAADALVRLQDVYGISAEAMARGQLTVDSRQGQEIDRSLPLMLTADSCLHLARQAFNRSMDSIAMDWIRLLKSDAFGQENQLQMMSALLEILETRIKSTVKPDEVGNNLRKAWTEAQGNATLFAIHASHVAQITEDKQNDMEKYRILCKDGSNSSSAQNALLVCRYAVPHPLFTLSPVKEELLSTDPRIVYWYDVLTDKESHRLMEIAEPKLKRAGTITSMVPDNRISKSAFIKSSYDWSVEQVNRKLGYMTSLNVSDSDLLQMGNYGIGGQYEPHMDSFGSGVTRGNNRVATVLLYLNSVKQGGGTVFPRLGLRVMPVKNGALFWYNMRRNSSDIYDTTHAACPVLEGSKWVSNKWIYYLGQMHHRPCSLNSLE